MRVVIICPHDMALIPLLDGSHHSVNFAPPTSTTGEESSGVRLCCVNWDIFDISYNAIY